MNVFFCDLIGTYNGNDEDRDNSIKRLVDNLIKMCNLLNIKELYFDFATTDEMSTLLPYIKEFESYLAGSPIKMASQFANHVKITNDGQIVKAICDTKFDKIYRACIDKPIERLFFADDTYIQHKMLNAFFNKKRPEIEIVSFMPTCQKSYPGAYESTSYGIEGLNEALESYLMKKKERKF